MKKIRVKKTAIRKVQHRNRAFAEVSVSQVYSLLLLIEEYQRLKNSNQTKLDDTRSRFQKVFDTIFMREHQDQQFWDRHYSRIIVEAKKHLQQIVDNHQPHFQGRRDCFWFNKRIDELLLRQKLEKCLTST